MTFLEALKTGRPIRRESQWAWCQWRHLGNDGGISKLPMWRALDTGAPLGITREDYLADDWQVLP